MVKGQAMKSKKYAVVLKAGLSRHRGGLAGILLLIFLVSLVLGCVLTVWQNSARYLSVELERAGYGDVTTWVSGVPDLEGLSAEIAALPDVEKVDAQQVIYTNYEVNGQESDSEGQLITFERGRYRFFEDDLSGYREEPARVSTGQVYVSPSLRSMFGVRLGDPINFPIARAGGTVTLTVAGFFEDPFMGSSMIGMKGFLISRDDHERLAEMIADSGIDALARDGAMLHIFSSERLTASELNSVINEQTSLSQYIEFVHSREAIRGFMLILQNAFSALLLAFALVLLLAVFAAVSHSIGSTLESDAVDMGRLKTVGYTSADLRRVQLLQYAAAIVPGMILGLALSPLLSAAAADATLTTTGLKIPVSLPISWCAGAFLLIAFLLAGFIAVRTAKIGRITPIQAIRGEQAGPQSVEGLPAVSGRCLSLELALRQLLTGKRKYAGAFLVAVLLVFFASLIGRMDSWLGPDGKGMMDAFNPADHDLGIQCFGTLGIEEAERTVLEHTEVLDHYVLAMPNVSVNGVDFTANVIDQPERFHILEGRTCTGENEIVITEFIASDFGVSIGDTVTVAGAQGSGTFTITGIYSCANDMGDNVGLNREDYLKIGADDPQLWCHHYFLSDPGQKAVITQELENAYGGDVHVHENTWPGLFGIIAAMNALLAVMYPMVAAFILIVTVMTGSKLISAEQRDTGIFKAIGFSDGRLRFSFALRFGVTALFGAAVGVVLAAILTDPLVSAAMKLAGISNFESHPTPGNVLLPAGAVVGLFTVFAYLAAGKIKKTDLTALIAE